jgi:hypothetical protein
MADVPAGQSVPSVPPKFTEPGNGATLPVIAPATHSAASEREEPKEKPEEPEKEEAK